MSGPRIEIDHSSGAVSNMETISPPLTVDHFDRTDQHLAGTLSMSPFGPPPGNRVVPRAPVLLPSWWGLVPPSASSLTASKQRRGCRACKSQALPKQQALTTTRRSPFQPAKTSGVEVQGSVRGLPIPHRPKAGRPKHGRPRQKTT